MSIILTGACGFIGSHVAERLIAHGNTVYGIDNFDPFYSASVKRRNIRALRNNPLFRLYEVDILDKKAIHNVFSEANTIECVIHLAAKAGVRPSIENPQEYIQTNIHGTAILLEAMAAVQVSNMIFASSSSVYGNTKTVPFCETAWVDNPVSPYAATKKSCELLCHTYAHLYGMCIASLRFFTVYGPRQRPDLAIAKFTQLIHSDKPITVFGDGTTQRDYTYIDDIIDGVMAAMAWLPAQQKGAHTVFNLGESDSIPLHKVISIIEETLDKKAYIQRQPLQMGDVLQTYADITRAREILGYNPQVDIHEGVRRYVEYFYNIISETEH